MASAAATLEIVDLPPLPPAREVPQTWSDSIHSWWATTVQFEKESAASEEHILRRLPSFLPSGVATPSPTPRIISRITQVALPSPHHAYINTLSMLPSTPSPSEPVPTVLLHGYAAGLGFYFKNLPYLADEWVGKRGGRIYALDWLGMGRSARVPFRIRSKGVVDKVLEAESFFVDSLEAWRKAQGIEKMALVGHSLGGYLSVAYALRYPERVSKLILLSPAGVPTSEHAHDVPSAELANPTPPNGKPNGKAKLVASTNGAPTDTAQVEEARKPSKEEQTRQRRSMMRVVGAYLWEQGVSPFSIVRWSGIYGPLLVSKYSSRRFSHLSAEDVRDMHNYIYHISRAKGSGEFCISHILAPGAYAYYPIVNRIQSVKVPVAFVYGDHDWMDPAGGLASIEKLKKAGNREGRIYIVPGAGHHVYLDNDDVVNRLIVDELAGKPYVGSARYA
ncbi:alpha/beta-hydrolase [Calocera viscosa TUFC12733]|uniref:Alpha/beta-hydrolase n=1 Tax=Calocera viscosa (strain TUFC12733) TaxID=1330018 RepID=A0A167KM87_CALVF|nr:alpha/beta-hydrolase [Calocera viscosa TUFC12733]